MPIDGHGHLVKQGWSGKGTGLRSGAIAKPITVIQKKTLSGIGKDRDEAFPFWDHVFQAAAVSIQLKLHNSDDESNDGSDDEGSETPALELKRTTTGIISNRRPLSGTPALSGATTPCDSQPRLSIMAAAKQQAARRMLYAAFYRGPVLAADEDKDQAPSSQEAGPSSSSSSSSSSVAESERKKSKKRKAGEVEEKQEKKRRKREAKATAKDAERKKGKGKEKAVEASDDEAADTESDDKASRAACKAAKAERRRRKAEKRVRKEERRKKKEERKASSQVTGDVPDRDTGEAGVAEMIPMVVDETADTQEAATKMKKARVKASTTDASSSCKTKKSKQP